MSDFPRIVDLAGLWTIRSQDGRFNLKGPMPGSILHELEKDGAFGPKGLFWREENRKAPALMDQAWAVSRNFTMPGDLLGIPGTRAYLVCEGLDTLATVRLNGTVIAKTDNQHRTWRIPLGRELKKGANHLDITFANALEAARQGQKRRELFSGGGGVETIPGFNHVRKCACSYGWDWGPQVPDAGIWRPIRIEVVRVAHLASVRVTQKHLKNRVDLTITPELDRLDDLPMVVETTLLFPDGRRKSATAALEAGQPVSLPLTVENPALWWPRGLGEQPLYVLETVLRTFSGDVIARDRKRLGLRTLTVDRSKDKTGERFAFVVNGVPFFAMGGDWIPEDVYLTRPSREETRRRLEDAVQANFNCLRVWGGGVYPDDFFFDTCDELGLVIWQDLMFACALYPWDMESFRQTTLAELRDNLNRMRHHACLGLICGNNEMEWAFEEWNMKGAGKRERREYLEMYQVDFARVAAEVCPEIFYWPASPSSGGDFEKPNDADRGDVHFWKVWHGRAPFEEYAKHKFRFLSEFGFESFPALKTALSFTEPGDRNVFSPVMEDHQRCKGGNGTILYYVSEHLRLPTDFAGTLYASQFIQAEAMRFGIEHMRRHRGICMGAVYWQYNDNWPVASWASVDHLGRWKMLHYVAKRIFAPQAASAWIDGQTAEIHLANEGRDVASGILSWSLQTLAGKKVKSGTIKASVPALTSRKLFSADFGKDLAGHGARSHVLVWVWRDEKGVESRGTASFCRIKHLELEDPKLSLKVVKEGDGFAVEVKAASYAKAVWLDLKNLDARFSDNGLDLAAGESRRIRIEWLSAKADGARLKRELTARSMVDSYRVH